MAATQFDAGQNDALAGQQAHEHAVGIDVFVGANTHAFSCVVKQRYTDFLVNEILPDGRVLHLVKDEPLPDRKRKRGERKDEEDRQKKLRLDDGDTADDANAIQPAAEGTNDKPVPDVQGAAGKGDVAVPGTSEVDTPTAKLVAIAGIKEEDRNALIKLFGGEVASSLFDLYACTVVFPHRKPRDQPTVLSKPFSEKSQRTEAHTAIRRIFGANRLESMTVQDPNNPASPATVISIRSTPPKAPVDPNKDEQQKGKIIWSELGGEYLHFSLYKENKDTMEVLYFIASQLKLHIKHFSFAGTKDRRGVTVQRVAVHRIKRERLESLNRIARGFRLAGPWEHKSEALALGMLGGNEFVLTLRDARFANEQPTWCIEERLKHASEIVSIAAKSLSTAGFLNYYGLQRFGTHSIGTHSIGMKILKGDLKGAVDGILSYDPALAALDVDQQDGQAANGHSVKSLVPRDDISRAKAIHAFRSGAKVSESLAYVPGPRFSAEKGMITFLSKKDHKTGAKPNETDYQGAILQIQRNLRLMYIHAYQSFVWNTVAGKRWQQFGAKVVEGDLVIVGDKEREEGIANGSNTRKNEVDENGEPIVHPTASAAVGTEDAAGAPDDAEYTDDPFIRARPLSKDEAESGRYTIFDVVLPLPGYDVVYPSNDVGKFYEEFMASEIGGGLDPHNMRRAWKEISLSGGYRKMMARPLGQGVEVDVKAYQSPDAQLVQTDLEKLEKREPASTSVPQSAEEQAQTGGKDQLAILLKLKLGSSQYATMALRELTKGGAAGYRPEYSLSKR
jgi:tRNA pseudouridine13 synthase